MNKTIEETKKCPSCDENISIKAKRCPYCRQDLRSGFRKHPILTAIGLFFLVSFIIGGIIDVTNSTQSSVQSSQKFPGLSEETMDKNFVLSCEGGDNISLWDKPTDAVGGANVRDRVPCGTFGWAFNKYYNESLNVTFYAINTNDNRVKNAYGWITEDLLTWR